MKLMKYFKISYLTDMKGCSVIDIGAKQVSFDQPTYREIFEPDYNYTGMDIVSGENVDIVGYEGITKTYDVLISGQTMEHIKRPWTWVMFLTRYFKRYICVIAPNDFAKEHRHPYDTYRFFPDGMRDLFEYAEIKELEIFKFGPDTIGIGTHYG